MRPLPQWGHRRRMPRASKRMARVGLSSSKLGGACSIWFITLRSPVPARRGPPRAKILGCSAPAAASRRWCCARDIECAAGAARWAGSHRPGHVVPRDGQVVRNAASDRRPRSCKRFHSRVFPGDAAMGRGEERSDATTTNGLQPEGRRRVREPRGTRFPVGCIARARATLTLRQDARSAPPPSIHRRRRCRLRPRPCLWAGCRPPVGKKPARFRAEEISWTRTTCSSATSIRP